MITALNGPGEQQLLRMGRDQPLCWPSGITAVKQIAMLHANTTQKQYIIPEQQRTPQLINTLNQRSPSRH
jgi:hypothetical protein